jgi:preprotein translocase subunit YajC
LDFELRADATFESNHSEPGINDSLPIQNPKSKIQNPKLREIVADAEKSTPTPAPAPPPPSAPITTAQTGTATGVPGDGQQAPNPLGQMVPMMAAFAIFIWLFILRPENKRRKQKEALLSSVKVKDKVVTIFGLYGTVVDIEGDDIVLNVDTKKDVKMRFRRSAIDSVVPEETKEKK